MSKYIVNVTRTAYGCAKIVVEADNAEDAKDKAIDQAGDADYSTEGADFEADAVEPVEEYSIARIDDTPKCHPKWVVFYNGESVERTFTKKAALDFVKRAKK